MDRGAWQKWLSTHAVVQKMLWTTFWRVFDCCQGDSFNHIRPSKIPATQDCGQWSWFQRIKQKGFSYKFYKFICLFNTRLNSLLFRIISSLVIYLSSSQWQLLLLALFLFSPMEGWFCMDDKETQKIPLLDQKNQWVIKILRVILRISKQIKPQPAPGFDIIIKLRYLGIF